MHDRDYRSVRTRLLLACGALFALHAWHALSRLQAVHHETFDLALYTRTAWGVVRGHGYASLIDLHFLSAHASLPLIPLGALGALTDTATVLLLAQAACIAATALPLARIGGRHLGPTGALAAGALFLLYPNTGHVATYEFHPGNLGLPAIGWALDALDRRDLRALWIASVAAVACRADFSLIVGGLALLWQLQAADPPKTALRALLRGPWQQPAGRLLLAAGAYFAVFALLVPALVAGGGKSAALHFGPWGGSPLGLLPTLFRDPAAVWAHFGSADTLGYLPQVLAPLALLPLLSPAACLPALPTLLLNLVSVFPTTDELYSHYLTPALPTLVYAAVRGATRLPTRLRGAALAAAGLCVVTGSVLAGGEPWSLDFPAAAFSPDARTQARRQALSAVPDGASVQAPNPLLPHLATRPRVHRAPPPERGTDYVVLDVSHRSRYAGSDTLLRTSEEPTVRNFLARGDHAPIAAPPGLLVLKRGRDARSGLASRYFTSGSVGDRPRRLCDCLELRGARVQGLGLSLDLRARKPCPADLAIRFGPEPRPRFADLLFDGLLSPAQLRAGDQLRSHHRLPPKLLARVESGALFVGALRSSGAPPAHGDPYAVRVALSPPRAQTLVPAAKNPH